MYTASVLDFDIAEEVFIRGFMAATGLSRAEAVRHWDAARISIADRIFVQNGAYDDDDPYAAGKRMGRQMMNRGEIRCKPHSRT